MSAGYTSVTVTGLGSTKMYSDNGSNTGNLTPVSREDPKPSLVAAGPISVGTSATLLIAARANRDGAIIVNETTTAMRIGGSNVTGSSNGVLLPGVVGASITVQSSADIYAAVASGTGSASVAETF